MGPITFQKSVSISLEIFLLISADSAGENTGSETQADSTDQNQEVDSSDSVNEQSVNTDNTNTANDASEEDKRQMITVPGIIPLIRTMTLTTLKRSCQCKN